jgi:hypothetical protein
MILVIVTNIFFKTSQTACSETATRAASFAVRAFNYHARKLTVRPTPGQTFCKAPWDSPMVSDDPAVRSAMHLVRRVVELKAILIPPTIPEDEKSPLVLQLLALIEHQGSIIQQQAEQLQQLKDEIARLKNQPPRPKIGPSSLEKKKKGKSNRPKGKRPGY